MYVNHDYPASLASDGWSRSMTDAMDGGFLQAYFQPKFNACGEMISVEALARWSHPSKGLLVPKDFLAVCDGADMSCELACQMTWQALRFAAQWRERTGENISVAINVQPDTIAHPAFSALLREFVDVHGLLPSHVIIEIVEQDLSGPADVFMHAIRQLRQEGYILSIDDFGTGAAGLLRLLDMPVDEVKIAGCFVDGVSREPRKAIIVESTIAMARRMGLTVVLEGIERIEDLEWLGRYRFPHVQMQGYCLARPKSPERLIEERMSVVPQG